ncbi:YkvA family protein [Rhizobium sp. FKL33]|uniref:YkvA family protein n=1 Tax=Rhizobium sp. FKL33 TaxID=2562307 RepID=UPI0010C03316|nr:YkvA family protein [Rhizobium sp. FKL33]
MDDIKIGEILLPGEEAETEKREAKVRARFWPVLKKAFSRLPFARDVVASYYCAIDPTTPRRVKAILLGALAYFILPFDTIPDLLAVVGFSDDIAVLAAAIAAVRSSLKPEHFDRADAALSHEHLTPSPEKG